MAQLDDSTVHQGIGYSISDLGSDRWRWTIHPKLKPAGELAPIIRGEISGTRDDAVAAARKAIETNGGQNSG